MSDRERVRRVFADAAEQPAERLAEFLDGACGGDAALRAEVESLLAAAARRPAFLGAPTAAGAGGAGAGGTDGEGMDGGGAGMIVGRYRLIREIGRGGFGSVYEAEQIEPVRRRVAVKIIKLGMDTRAVIARFEAERQALAMMDHANIARVLDAGATESGRPYFVMELVEGDPITAFCDRSSLGIAERLGVFVQVCRAVQHAHSKGVIHRDIKPGNVLVTMEDGRALVKVIDFGIAKATQHGLTGRTVFTELRQFIGTPEYMSPEQAEGSQNTDTRTDVYSLGVLLYELLTGATPFDPAALRAAAYGEIQRIIREVEPPRPSTRVSTMGEAIGTVASRRGTAPGRLSPMLRGDLDWIVMRCLEKDRSRRYATSDALAEDLAAFLRGDPVSAVPPSAGYRARKFAARNRGLVAGAGAVLAALLIGVAGTTWGMFAARRAERTARMERAGAATVRDFLSETFAGVAPQVARGRSTELLGALMDKAAGRIESGELAGNAEAERELRVVIAEVYAEIARYERARRMLTPIRTQDAVPAHVRSRLLLLRAELALADSKVDQCEAFLDEVERLIDAQPDPDPMLRVHILGVRSQAALTKNLATRAIDLERQALAAARLLPRADPELIANRLLRLGIALHRDGREDESIEAWAEALRELDRADAEAPDRTDSPTRVDLFVVRAAARGQRSETQLALADLEEARRLGEGMFPPNHPTMQGIRNSLANIHLHSGRSGDAIPEFEVLLATRRVLFGPESLPVASTLDNIAETHYIAGRWQHALDAALEVERIRALHLPPEECAALNAWTTVADSLCRLGRSAEALPLARRSVELQSAVLAPESEAGVLGRHVLIKCLYAEGRLTEVAAEGRSLIALCAERRPDNPPPSLLDTHVLTGVALLDHGNAGDLPECEQLFRVCIARRREQLGERDPRVAFARILLGRTVGARVLLSADEPPAAADRSGVGTPLERLREAESLIAPNFQILVDHIGRLDPSIRARRVREAADSLIAIYEAWGRFEPGFDRSDLARQWRERRDSAVKAIETGVAPPLR